MDLLKVALKNTHRLAVVAGDKSYTYHEILSTAVGLAGRLKQILGKEGKWGPRVGLYLKPSAEYVAATWGTWMAGGILVPLCLTHTHHELQYVIEDTGMPVILSDEENHSRLPPVHSAKVELIQEDRGELSDTTIPTEDQGALIIYTSGTTGRPKGALHTHKSLNAQMKSMSFEWKWKPDDTILHCLPLHHIHGIVNGLYTAHYNAACVKMLPKFSPYMVWSSIKVLSLLLVGHLIWALGGRDLSFYGRTREERESMREAARKLRLYVSGSSACPISIMNRWKEATDHWLLERYGMTEIGMALSNPLEGERRPGFVGRPMLGVTVKVDGKTKPSGELLVKGDCLFSEYWQRPEATKEAFTDDGYFKTSDVVMEEGDPPYFRILGRNSVDIIKSGGFKLSALEIESVILEHPLVKECSVLGVPDEVYGELVTAVVSAEGQDELDLQSFCREKLAPYKIPRKVIRVESIPRNSMGKVNKADLRQMFS